MEKWSKYFKISTDINKNLLFLNTTKTVVACFNINFVISNKCGKPFCQNKTAIMLTYYLSKYTAQSKYSLSIYRILLLVCR